MAKAPLTISIFLALLLALVVWRIWILGSLAWESAAAVQRLRSEANVASPSMNLPQIRADLHLLADKLAALDAELQPLAPALDALGGLGSYGAMLAAAPEGAAAARELADATAQASPALAWLLGSDAPRTFLLVVQNNHELRATGGFISAFGTLVVADGQLGEITFADSYDFFSTAHEYGPAPEPMQQYMGIQLLVPRDANWSPDLPTAAETIRTLYTRETGQPVDGIITLDLHAVRHLAAALGKLHVDGVKTPITAENVEQELVRLWEQPPGGEDAAQEGAEGDWWSRRKDFVPLVADAALARIQAGDFDPLALAAALHAALDDRSLQLWLNQPEVQQALAAQGWDGGLHPKAGADFLAVVDSNVGYNKVDAAIVRALDYAVTWPDGGGAPATATLTLTYTHPIAAEDPGCNPAPRYGATYADLIARCYFDYVRVYAPRGSRLTDIAGIDPETVTSTEGEQGTQVFGGYFVLPPGTAQAVTFTYQLPPAIQPAAYNLLVQRQAGTDPLALNVSVDGKSHSTVLSAAAFCHPDLTCVR